MAKSAKRLRIVGTVVLIAGLIAGATIYVTASSAERDPILGLDIRTNRDRHQLERMGGKGYVMMKDFDEWFATLWHGRRLGCTVGVLSIVGFFLCRGLAYVEDAEARIAAQARQAKGPSAEPGARAHAPRRRSE